MTRDDEARAALDALYPVAEKQPQRIRTPSDRPLADVSLDNLMAGRLGRADIGITADGLRTQAEVARLAGRTRLAENFERGAELVDVPDDLVLAAYELLRPGRAKAAQDLIDMAARLRRDHGAAKIADFIEEAARVYETRGLFRKRY